PPSDADHIRKFSINGARVVHNGSPAPDRVEDPKWSILDLLRGITPKNMLSEWSLVFRPPTIHRHDGFAQVCRLSVDIGHGTDLEAEVFCDDRMEANAIYVYQGQDH
ncbi:hypothetical protein BGZ96_007725, partial [Linnemannia gamsii]